MGIKEGKIPIKGGEMQCERRFRKIGRKTEGRERERERIVIVEKR